MCWASQFLAQLISSQPTGTCWSSSTTQKRQRFILCATQAKLGMAQNLCSSYWKCRSMSSISSWSLSTFSWLCRFLSTWYMISKRPTCSWSSLGWETSNSSFQMYGSGVLCWVFSLYLYLKSVFLMCWASQFMAQSMYSVETGLVTGQGLEEDVVLQLVGIRVARLTALHELLLLVVEVVPEDVSVVVQDVNVLGVVLQLLHDVKEDDVLIIESLVEHLEGLIPDIGVGHGEGHHVLVPEIGVGDMLGEPVLCKVNPFLADGGVQAPHGHQEGVVLVDVLVQLLLGVGGRLCQEVGLLDEVVLIALEARGSRDGVLVLEGVLLA